MLEFLILAVSCRLIISLGGETSQSLLIDVEPNWVDPSDGHIDTEVKLKSVDEEGVVDIVAYDK